MTYYTADTHSQAYIHTLTRELRAFMYASSKTSLLLFVRECTRALAPSRNENRVFARRSTNGNGFRINTELTCIPPTGIHTRPHLYHINAQLYNYMDASHPANTYMHLLFRVPATAAAASLGGSLCPGNYGGGSGGSGRLLVGHASVTHKTHSHSHAHT